MNSTTNLVTVFEPSKVAFGRHETFPLRYSWLTKGFMALQKNQDIFSSDQATVALGVGKNMVNSIRYWLRAMRMIDTKDTTPTELGQMLLSEDGFDPYLEDEATIWLLHWLHATNPEQATTAYWLFNRYHKPEFTAEEMVNALLSFAKEHITGKYSVNTVKQDAAVILRMYAPSRKASKIPLEDMLDSPLSTLGLLSVQETKRGYATFPESRPGLPVEVVAFALTELLAFHDTNTMMFQELMYGRLGQSALASIFRLSETALLTIIEQIVIRYPDLYEIRETAGVHQIYQLRDIGSFTFLKSYYEPHVAGVAA